MGRRFRTHQHQPARIVQDSATRGAAPDRIRRADQGRRKGSLRRSPVHHGAAVKAPDASGVGPTTAPRYRRERRGRHRLDRVVPARLPVSHQIFWSLTVIISLFAIVFIATR